MAELKKKATRESYGEALAELGDKYDNLYVFDADLAAATKTGIFKKKFPDRFFDCGIAESNMMGVAAGMAATGKIPFASTFAMFAAGRAFEQVRNSIGYPHLNVKIGATHAGISVGEDGATHQCNEDIALMRTIPGMVVINPADDVEAKAAVEAAILHEGPVYLRFGRLATPVFNDPETYKFELGKGVKLRDGKDIAIVATGLMVYEAIEAAKHWQPRVSKQQLSISTLSSQSTRISSLKPQRTQDFFLQLRSIALLADLAQPLQTFLQQDTLQSLLRSALMTSSVTQARQLIFLKNMASAQTISLQRQEMLLRQSNKSKRTDIFRPFFCTQKRHAYDLVNVSFLCFYSACMSVDNVVYTYVKIRLKLANVHRLVVKYGRVAG